MVSFSLIGGVCVEVFVWLPARSLPARHLLASFSPRPERNREEGRAGGWWREGKRGGRGGPERSRRREGLEELHLEARGGRKKT